MANNYVLLSSTILQSTVTSVTFSNLPQTGFTNLKVYISARGTRANPSDTCFMKLNGDYNTALYDYTQMYGYGNAGAVGTGSSSTAACFSAMPSANAPANYYGSSEFEIFGYTSSEYKPVRNSDVNGWTDTTNWQIDDTSFLYKSNSPITSITVSGDVGNLVAGSNIAIYGLANANQTPASPKAIGGDIVVNDGTYWYHAFLKSGSFTPISALTANCLVVAGGGGGSGGGGGAGGLQLFSSQALLATSYSVTIGAGGAAGVQGSNSQFGALTASTGGGYGGGYNESTTLPNPSGGSGGGGGAKWNTSLYNQPGGNAVSGQGNNGGNGLSQGGVGVSNVNGGGGGGAGAVGSNASTGQGGAGGAGTNSYSTWLSPTGLGVSGYIAGGGGGGSYNSGGAGGAGGGGAGTVNAGVAGTANTGSGGGGGYNGGTGYTGGSGVVIIRYAV